MTIKTRDLSPFLKPDSHLVSETERLVLRTWSLSEAATLHAISQDTGFNELSTTRFRIPDLDHASQVIVAGLGRFTADGLGIWPTLLKDRGTVIGIAGLNPIEIEGRSTVEVIFRLMGTHWGKGYATEAVKGLIRYGFEDLRLDEVIALIDPRNMRASNVVEKAGLGLTGTFRTQGIDAQVYRIRRSH